MPASVVNGAWMTDSLKGLSVLIVEDEFYLADDLALALADVSAKVLGPFGRVEEARRVIEDGHEIDLAVLNINLVGDRVFPIADLLHQKGTPFLFATGYDPEIIPERLSGAPRLEKPVGTATVLRALEALHRER